MKNKKILVGILGIAIIALVGATIAYFNQLLSIDNPFDTGKYSTTLVETFNPEDGENWEPGVTVDKFVEVINTGDQPVVVRVKLDEEWARELGVFKQLSGLPVYTTYQEDPLDGLVELDHSVVTKNFLGDFSTKWIWVDGWYYFNNVLLPGESTGAFIESVTLLADVDLGVYTTTNYYSEADVRPLVTDLSLWTAFTGPVPAAAKHSISVTVLDDDLMGYSDAFYTLTITAQTVQATTGAVEEVFLGFDADDLPLGISWDLMEE